MISWGSWWLHGVRGRILCRVWCYWHSWLWLDSHRLISLIWGYWVVGWHSLLLGIGSVNHCSGSSGGHNRPWSSTCFIQTATWTGEAQNNSNYNHRTNSNSNGNKGSKTGARRNVIIRVRKNMHVIYVAWVRGPFIKQITLKLLFFIKF